MKSNFKGFIEELTITPKQKDDAQTKYTGVCEKLHSKYYNGSYLESNKFLFGSYKTHSSIRPIAPDQDVDVIFKIPKETLEKFKAYTSNGPAALLQEIKECLNEKYTTTDEIKAWGKVVLVQFTTGAHNVEVLPAFENEDGSFTIPNSENGGSWDLFNPRSQVDAFNQSNQNTNGLTRDLVKMLKAWVRNVSTLKFKSYLIVETVIPFLDDEYPKGAEYEKYPEVLRKVFDYIKKWGDPELNSHAKTAYDRSVKAIEHSDNDKPKEASEEWRKIFGEQFPLVKENPSSESKSSNAREFNAPVSPWRK